MALFRSKFLALLPALALAQNSSAAQQLQAEVALRTNSSWHVGGFCIGKAASGTSKAAQIIAHVDWEGTKQLGETGPVMLVAYDAREGQWGSVRDTWNQNDANSCESKTSSANMVRHLGLKHNHDVFKFEINVHQQTAARDWHFAILTCGDTEPATLSLTLEAEEGALSIFEANTHFDESSCPEVGVAWLPAASSQVGFWLMLLAAVLFGCSAVMAVVAWKMYRQKVEMKRFKETASAGGTEPVIGKPCAAIGESKVVDGQTNLDFAMAPESRNDSDAVAQEACVGLLSPGNGILDLTRAADQSGTSLYRVFRAL